MSDLRQVVDDHWRALDNEPRRPAWLTSALPVEATGSPVLCAIDPDGKRHLLVPARPGDIVEPDTRAAAVHLLPLTLEWDAKSTYYANLVLLRDDLADIFTGLCADVIVALAMGEPAPLVAVAQVLDGWHELFRSGSRLGVEQLAGLFGELTFLNALLDRDVDMVRAWRGPLRSPHDFVSHGWAAEIKATASSEGKTVRIHGLDQLDIPSDGGLMLLWMRLDTADAAGTSLPELVGATAKRVGRPHELWQLLARAGYLMADRDKYDGIRFAVIDQAAYRVTAEFPRIVPSSFTAETPAGISDVRYTVDLNFGPPPMQTEEFADFMNVMTRK